MHFMLLYYITAVFFNLFAAAEPHTSVRSLMEPHALIHQSSNVREVEATGCLYGLISLAKQSPPWERQSRQK